MQTTEIKVDGMTCGSCVASVTKALKGVPGVRGVEVDLGKGIVRVRGEDVAHSVGQLVAALDEAGYEAGIPTAAPPTRRQQDRACIGDAGGAAPKGRGGCCCG